MNKTTYIDEFRNRIIDQAFKFANSTYFCIDAKRQIDKLIVTTKNRTFVFLFSQLDDITILQPTEKTLQNRKNISSIRQRRSIPKIVSGLSPEMKVMSKKVNEAFNNRKIIVQVLPIKKGRPFTDKFVKLSEERKAELSKKYFNANFGSKHQYYTLEEDELVLTVDPSTLATILGRTFSSLTVRKCTLKKKMTEGETLKSIHSKTYPVTKKSKFDPKTDALILSLDNAKLLKKFPQFTTSQISGRRQYIKRKQLEQTT